VKNIVIFLCLNRGHDFGITGVIFKLETKVLCQHNLGSLSVCRLHFVVGEVCVPSQEGSSGRCSVLPRHEEEECSMGTV